MCRAISFILLGLSAGLPFIFVEITKSSNERFYLPTQSGMPWLNGGFIYIGGALIYGFRIPEKCFPKRFDLVGSSHQIFHIAVLGGFAVQFNDALRIYNDSKTFVCPVEIPQEF